MERFKQIRKIVSIVTLIVFFINIFGGHGIGNVEAASKKRIILNKKSAVLTVGQTTVIKVKKVQGLKSKGVIYKSSNSKIASVSKNGKVTAKKAGKATIVVISKQDKKVKAKVSIKVKAKKIKKQQDYNKYLTEKAVRKSLEIPDDAVIKIVYGKPFYWENGRTNLVDVKVAGKGKYEGYYAGACFTESGRAARQFILWAKMDNPFGNVKF